MKELFNRTVGKTFKSAKDATKAKAGSQLSEMIVKIFNQFLDKKISGIAKKMENLGEKFFHLEALALLFFCQLFIELQVSENTNSKGEYIGNKFLSNFSLLAEKGMEAEFYYFSSFLQEMVEEILKSFPVDKIEKMSDNFREQEKNL